MWGNLSCTMIVHPEVEKKYKKEVDNAIENLKYGTIAINTWAASAYALCSPVWYVFLMYFKGFFQFNFLLI